MGELLQTLYNSVDLLVVGNFVSNDAQAAISVGATISNLIISFFNGMSVGVSVIVARAFGKGERNGLVTTIETTFTYSVVLGLILGPMAEESFVRCITLANGKGMMAYFFSRPICIVRNICLVMFPCKKSMFIFLVILLPLSFVKKGATFSLLPFWQEDSLICATFLAEYHAQR